MERPVRRHPRLREFDYAANGACFVTVCVKGMARVLSTIVGRDDPGAPREIQLTALGTVADKYIRAISGAYAHVTVEKYVIMPNHVHILLSIDSENGAPGSSRPTISQIIGAWKRFVHLECGEKIFQSSYYDHIIRDENDFLDHWRYIDENPLKWDEDEYNIPE